jgi:protoporphyrinogen oxidase
MSTKTALIIGAGPAGLTAALEMLRRTDIKPIIFESSDAIGGISQTICYKGNRMDIGGHRFFSKSDRVMQWWQGILPIQGVEGGGNGTVEITYQRKARSVAVQQDGPDPTKTDNVMLIRQRLSRIYYQRKFFDYPVSLNGTTIRNLGVPRMAKIGSSYMWARVRQIKPEKSLQDFMINRFGNELYRTFFKDYTEKVWGVPCEEIDPEWGAQRIKGVSISTALKHAITKPFKRDKSVAQKGVETSLIEQFMYPKLGPGQMWEEVARMVEEMGGEIHMRQAVTEVHHDGKTVTGITVVNQDNDEAKTYTGDYVFSTMPVKELVAGMGDDVPKRVLDIAGALPYRDFITVGVLLKRLAVPGGEGPANLVPDNWIYVQEPDVKVGRLQIFNNWSPYLVADQNTAWLGMEYFCYEGDDLWSKSDDDFFEFAVNELAHIGIIEKKDVLDGTVRRVKKTYPAYFGAYHDFDEVRNYVDKFDNLFLLGRNGMHRYNNADHSMLTAMTAVDNIIKGITDKANIWAVNTESDYHEEK